MKAYLSTAILFKVLALLLRQAKWRQETAIACLPQSGLQTKNEVHLEDFYATTHKMDIKKKINPQNQRLNLPVILEMKSSFQSPGSQWEY